MKKVLSIIISLFFVFSGCSSPNDGLSQNETVTKEPPSASEKSETELNTLLDETVDDSNFCGTVVIYYNGEKLYEGNRGYADKEQKIENSPSLIYRIGSLSKQFAAAGICILYDEGKIDINDSISKYFTDCNYGDKVTIKNLLNMSSGIPTFTGDYDLTPNYTGKDLEVKISATNTAEQNKDSIVEWILSQELIFKPGEKFDYSNSNYTLLGKIIENVSGESYENFITEKIFNPLNMKSTTFDSDKLNTKGYVYDSVKTEEQALKEMDTEWTMYPGVTTAIGDICSSVEDLHKWITALKNGEVLKENTLEMMLEANELGYGFGFFTSDYVCYHSGALGTYMSEISFFREKDFSIILLTNTHSEGLYNDICSQLNNVIAYNQNLLQ